MGFGQNCLRDNLRDSCPKDMTCGCLVASLTACEQNRSSLSQSQEGHFSSQTPSQISATRPGEVTWIHTHATQQDKNVTKRFQQEVFNFIFLLFLREQDSAYTSPHLQLNPSSLKGKSRGCTYLLGVYCEEGAMLTSLPASCLGLTSRYLSI